MIVKNSYLIVFMVIICLSISIYFIVRNNNMKNQNSHIIKKQEVNLTSKRVFFSNKEIQDDITDFYDVGTDVTTANTGIKNKLNVLLENKNLSVKELSEKENLILSFLKDNSINRKEKIDTLWNIFNNLNNTEAQKFIIDYLSIMLPVELTADIINKYEECKDISLKKKLISLLNTSLYIANENLDKNKLQFIAKKTEEIEQFFKEQLLNIEDINSDLTQYLIELIPDFLSADDSYQIINELVQKTNLSKNKEYSLKVRIAFATNDTELEFVPKLLKELKKLTKKEAKLVNHNLYSFIKLGSNNEYIIPDLIDYIDSQKPISYDKEVYIDYLEWSAHYYEWLEARASIDKLKKDDYIINTLFNSDNPIYQANIIIYANDTILNRINSNKSVIIQNIQTSLENDTLTVDERTHLNDALQILEEKKEDQINNTEDINLPIPPTKS